MIKPVVDFCNTAKARQNPRTVHHWRCNVPWRIKKDPVTKHGVTLRQNDITEDDVLQDLINGSIRCAWLCSKNPSGRSSYRRRKGCSS